MLQERKRQQVENVIKLHGIPEDFVSDREPLFWPLHENPL